MSRPVPFVHPISVRYLEVDRQGVVFNMWYLAYLDDAMTAFLSEGGLPYADMLAAGYDVQVVHTELDWHGPLGLRRPGRGAGGRGRASVGRRSRCGSPCCRRSACVVDASTVYVVGPHRRVGEVRASPRRSSPPWGP